MNSKGFTLIELLAIVVLLAVIASIGTFVVTHYIDATKSNTDSLLISNIRLASQLYIDECTNGVSDLNNATNGEEEVCNYSKEEVETGKKYTIMEVTLQDLADYNYLSAINNKVLNSSQKDVGKCVINIIKNVSNDYEVTYQIKSITDSVDGIVCPVRSGEYY